MRIPPRDVLATVLVGLGVVVYIAWLAGYPLPALDGPAAIALAVLVVGVGASASAVVPGFADLMRGSRSYMAITSAIGLVALIGGAWAVYAKDALALAILVGCTIVLWAISTVRHMTASETRTLA
jgi:hypothetical protein